MPVSLDNKPASVASTQPWVLLTGAAGGLGKVYAAECASRGWNLFLTDLQGSLLPPLAAGMRRLYGVQVDHFCCDLTEPSARDDLWQAVAGRGLRFMVLINLAGIEYEGQFVQRSIPELRTIQRLHTEVVMDLSHTALRYRDPAQPFHILNISSLAAFFPMPVKSVYAASKRFMLDFSLALGQEVAGSGVKVMVLCPAGLPTCERSINGIRRQGIAGVLTTGDAGRVAARSLDLLHAGRRLYIPGAFNRFLVFLSRLVPPTLVAAFIWRRWQRIHGRAPETRL